MKISKKNTNSTSGTNFCLLQKILVIYALQSKRAFEVRFNKSDYIVGLHRAINGRG